MAVKETPITGKGKRRDCLPFLKGYVLVELQSLHGQFGLTQNWCVMGHMINRSFNQRFNASCTTLVTSESTELTSSKG
ncbi:MAG: hypothetical protein WC325_00975 [Candidatus Bathyarchaeia archaeon]